MNYKINDMIGVTGGLDKKEKVKNTLTFISNYSENNDKNKEKPYKKKVIFNNFIDELSDIIYNHTKASYNQIQIKILQNLAFIFSYGGFNKENLSFYVLDLSATGTGKSSIRKKLYSLLFKPIFEDLEQRNELQNEKMGKLIKAIHNDIISKEALFECFETIPTQIITIGEMGRALKRDDPIFKEIIELYGSNNINLPTFKNNKKHKYFIEDINFFFDGDTNLEYLGIKEFYEHLKGGLINRCLISFNNQMRDFEDLPPNFKIKREDITIYNQFVKGILEFSKKTNYSPINENFQQNKHYIEFYKKIYNKEKELLEYKNPFSNLYIRVIQNLNSIIKTLHLIDCYLEGVFINEVKETTIIKAIEFIDQFIANYDNLINEIIEYKEVQNELLEHKIINKIKELLKTQDKANIREIYKPLKISKNTLLITIQNYIRDNGIFKIIKRGKSTYISYI